MNSIFYFTLTFIVFLSTASKVEGEAWPGYGHTCYTAVNSEIEPLTNWNIDIFAISDLCKDDTLKSITMTIFENRGLIKSFRIDSGRFRNFLTAVQDHYHNNPYHNQIHAADVVHSVNVLVSFQIMKDVLSDWDILALILAAAVHDVDHPGLTNEYLIKTNSPLAIKYQNESVLEQHHFNIASKLLQQYYPYFLKKRQYFWQENVSSMEQDMFLKTVSDLILATDMRRHEEHLQVVENLVMEAENFTLIEILQNNPTKKFHLMQSIIHLADISASAKISASNWSSRVYEEFQNQGRMEVARGLELCALCNITSENIEKSQTTFIDDYVYPMYKLWVELIYPEGKNILKQLERNRQKLVNGNFLEEDLTSTSTSKWSAIFSLLYALLIILTL